MQLSKNFQLSEFERSPTAILNGIVNKVPAHIIPNIQGLVNNVLQPLRDAVGLAIDISSGYRNDRLNILVKGDKSSQHKKGEASDIKIVGLTPYQIARRIIDLKIDFDQVILYPTFVHVSYTKGFNRGEILYNKSYTGQRLPIQVTKKKR